MINQEKLAAAIAQQTTQESPEVVIERINAALEKAEPTAQYSAIKGIVGRKQVAVLKQALGLDGYVTEHQMRWHLINAYNA